MNAQKGLTYEEGGYRFTQVEGTKLVGAEVAVPEAATGRQVVDFIKVVHRAARTPFEFYLARTVQGLGEPDRAHEVPPENLRGSLFFHHDFPLVSGFLVFQYENSENKPRLSKVCLARGADLQKGYERFLEDEGNFKRVHGAVPRWTVGGTDAFKTPQEGAEWMLAKWGHFKFLMPEMADFLGESVWSHAYAPGDCLVVPNYPKEGNPNGLWHGRNGDGEGDSGTVYWYFC